MPADPVYIPEKFMPLFGDYDHAALFGGRGTAKSYNAANALVILSARKPLRIVCGRQYQTSIRDSSKQLIETRIHALKLSSQFWIGEQEIVHEQHGSRYSFIGLDRNPQSVKSLDGCDYCWIDEARDVGLYAIETLIPTVLRKPGSKMIWTWNPKYPKDPIDAYFRGNHLRPEERANWSPPPNSYVCQVGPEDNPYWYHTKLHVQAQHMLRTNPKRHRHIYGGEYDLDFEGRIFSRVRIGRPESIPEWISPRYGMDFSQGGADPHAIVKVYVNQPAGWIYVAREAGGRVSSRELPGLLRDVIEHDDDLVKADSSQPDLINNLNTGGFRIRGARKGPGSVKAGITWLQGFEIIIDPECPRMIEEAQMYSWQQDRKTHENLNAPVDDWNHYWDAVRYATEDCQTEDGAPDADGGVMRLKFGRRR